MQKVSLDDYNIIIGDIWEELHAFLKERKYAKIAVLVDENTSQHCLPVFLEKAPARDYIKIEIPAGEQHKNIATCQTIWQSMMQHGMDRKSLCINIGGGVIGDMGGFCASTFKRGMDFIQMPTTLLSQVDASIGGKLGIDFMQVKNSIGLFKNPQAVFIAPEFFKTLSFEEIRSGFAEVVKHALIADDQQWKELQKIKDIKTVDWIDYLEPSLQIKRRVVEEDPFEKGLRKALNFGHTIGHAVEGWALETDKPLLHGEAIAIGMICESWLAHKIIDLPLESLERITNYFLSIYDPYPLDKTVFPEFIKLMGNDKKNENSQINFSLINPIGEAVINQTCDDELILESLEYYNSVIGA